MNILKYLLDERSIAFILGMGAEGAGLAIMSALGFPIFPAGDAIFAAVVVMIILLYIHRAKIKEKEAIENRERLDAEKIKV